MRNVREIRGGTIARQVKRSRADHTKRKQNLKLENQANMAVDIATS